MGREKHGHHFGAAAVLGRSQFVLRTARRKVRGRNKSPRLHKRFGGGVAGVDAGLAYLQVALALPISDPVGFSIVLYTWTTINHFISR